MRRQPSKREFITFLFLCYNLEYCLLIHVHVVRYIIHAEIGLKGTCRTTLTTFLLKWINSGKFHLGIAYVGALHWNTIEGRWCKQQQRRLVQQTGFCRLQVQCMPGISLTTLILFSVAYAYPITIFDVFRSTFTNKIFHCVFMASFSCPVQRSFLIERNESQKMIQTSNDFSIVKSLHDGK